MLNNNKSVNNMLSEILQYMESENIKINKTNYKLELLNFIAENTLNDLDNSKFINEAVKVFVEENYNSIDRSDV